MSVGLQQKLQDATAHRSVCPAKSCSRLPLLWFGARGAAGFRAVSC